MASYRLRRALLRASGSQFTLVAAGLALLLQPASAAAQLVSRPAGVEVDTARVFGDDAPRPTGSAVAVADGFSITAGLITEYSDNMARQSDDSLLPPRFESREDIRFQPSVSLSVGRPLGRQRVFANVLVGRDFYVRNTILDNNRFLIDGGLEWAAGSRCGGRVQGGFEERGTRFDQFAIVVPSTQQSINFYASAVCESPVGISPNISYNWSKTTNDITSDDPLISDLRDLQDVTGQGFTGSLTYALGGRGSVGGQVSWSTSDFPNRVFNGQVSGTNIVAVLGTAEYRFGPALRATAGLGYNWANSKQEFNSDYSGTTYEGSLAYSGPRLGATISVSQGISDSTGGFSTFSINTDFQFGVTYRTGERIGFNAGFARSDVDLRGLENSPVEVLQQDYSLDRFFIGGDYRLNRRFSAGLNFSHEKRSSNPDLLDFKVNSISLSVQASF